MIIQINWRPSRQQLRTFGLISTLAFGAIGAWIYFGHQFMGLEISGEAATTTAYGLWAIAALSAASALVSPKAILPLYLALTVVTLPIGFVVSHAMMLTTYYLVITPIGIMMRALGRDPMARQFDRKAGTYWLSRSRKNDAKQYLRQY